MTEPVWYQADPQVEVAYTNLMSKIREQRSEMEIEASIAFLVGLTVGIERRNWVFMGETFYFPPSKGM